MKSMDERKMKLKAIRFIELGRVPRNFGESVIYNSSEIAKFVGQMIRVQTIPDGTPNGMVCIEIKKGQEVMQVFVGDYIIKSGKGDFHICKYDIFKEMYEGVE